MLKSELELHDDDLKRVMTPRTSVAETVESRVFTRSVCMGVVT
jgi:alpha-D-ribose 1-methylphosphonate 5-triphosphate diphosphatase PhnM